MEGTFPIKLTTTAPATRTTYGEEAPSQTLEFERYAARVMDQSAGSEAVSNDSAINVGGALTWIVRADDELDGYEVDMTDPANPVLGQKVRPRISAGWRLQDLMTGEWYEITSVTEMRVVAGELRYRLHTKNSPLATP